MNVTSRDVATRAGVSRATVSQILNGRDERFSAETRELVIRTAAELDYQPSAAARSLARGSSELVIALVPNSTFGPNLQDMFDEITDELAQSGLTVMLRLSSKSPRSFDRLIAGLRPLAVISLLKLNDADRAVLTSRNVMLVEPEAAHGGGDLNDMVAQAQFRYLSERGHTRLAYARMLDSRQDPFGAERQESFARASVEAGLGEPISIALRLTLDDAKRAIASLPTGTAVACYNDDVAISLILGARSVGRAIPDDISLIGMDDTPFAAMVTPRLTTLHHSVGALAHEFAAATVAAANGIVQGVRFSEVFVVDGDSVADLR